MWKLCQARALYRDEELSDQIVFLRPKQKWNKLHRIFKPYLSLGQEIQKLDIFFLVFSFNLSATNLSQY